MDGFSSLDSIGSSSPTVNKETLEESLKVLQLQAAIQQQEFLVQTINDKCFKMCVTSPGLNLDNSQQFIHTSSLKLYLLDPMGSKWHNVVKATNNYSRCMLVRPSGEQLTKLQPGMIDHPVRRDNYSCGVIVIKLATEFLKQLPATLENPDFSTNGNYLRKMCIDLAKSILADTDDLHNVAGVVDESIWTDSGNGLDVTCVRGEITIFA